MAPEVWIVVALGGVAFVALAILTRNESGPSLADGQSEAAPGPDASSEALAALLPRIALRERDTESFGRWKEGRIGDFRVAFQNWDKAIAVFVGNFDPDREQISETYLGQVNDDQPLPEEGSPRRLSEAIGPDSLDLDARFFLNATGGGPGPLARPAVRAALGLLSETVFEVMVFETGGVQLIVDSATSAPSLASDVDAAIDLHRAAASHANFWSR